jgi:hypothetical protein
MKSLFSTAARSFVTQWAPRQVLKLVAAAATVIGVSDAATVNHTAAFVVAGTSFLVELVVSRIAHKSKS